MKKKQRTTPFDLLFPDTAKIKIRRILLDNREEAAGPLINARRLRPLVLSPPPPPLRALRERIPHSCIFLCSQNARRRAN